MASCTVTLDEQQQAELLLISSHLKGSRYTLDLNWFIQFLPREMQGDVIKIKEIVNLPTHYDRTLRFIVSYDSRDEQATAEQVGDAWLKANKIRNELGWDLKQTQHCSGDSDMGFGPVRGKRNARFPESIKDLDYSTLHNSQLWVLGDFVGARREMSHHVNNKPELQRVLKEACEKNIERAQFGYDIIVLQKEPKDSTSALPKEVEARYLELLVDVLNKYSAGLEQSAANAMDKIKGTLDEHANTVKAGLKDFAKQAIVDAAEKRAPIIIKEGDKKRVVKGVLPPEFKTMVELASARIPILLVGPAGCGKTYLAAKLAEALGMEYSDQSCSEGMSESVFNGRLLPIGKGGSFIHVPTPYMVRYETGGVMLLDEIDAGDPNLFTYLNKSIANDSYTVEQRYSNPRVAKHEDFVLVAAANTYGSGADAMYVGRNQLDAATLDRFRVGLITMDYCREVEEALAPQEVCEWAWTLRDKIRAQRLKRIMSTRVIKDLGKMTRTYKWGRVEWERSYFAGWSDAERKQVA